MDQVHRWIATGRTLKDMIKDVSHGAFYVAKVTQQVASEPRIFHNPCESHAHRQRRAAPRGQRACGSPIILVGDIGAWVRIEQPATHAGQGNPLSTTSALKLVLMSNKRSPYPGLIKLLGNLIDGDTLAEVVAIMAEPDEAEAGARISAMQNRIERRLTEEEAEPRRGRRTYLSGRARYRRGLDGAAPVVDGPRNWWPPHSGPPPTLSRRHGVRQDKVQRERN
jgi:hypothetical protein